MSDSHAFGFDKTKALIERRKQRLAERQLKRHCARLTQDVLEECLADVEEDQMRAACLAHWRPYLTFTPADDTLARADELREARTRATQGNDERHVTTGLLSRTAEALGLSTPNHPVCARCGQSFDEGWIDLAPEPALGLAATDPVSICNACLRGAGLCACNHTPVSAPFSMRAHAGLGDLFCVACHGRIRQDQQDAVIDALRAEYNRRTGARGIQ